MTATAPAKPLPFTLKDWAVTEEKIIEAVERIIAVANPLKIIAFGSRARGDFRPESDLDLAVIVDHLDPDAPRPVTRSTLGGVIMPIDLLVFGREQYDQFSGCINSVQNEIEREGIVLYDRQRERSANRSAARNIV